MAATQVIRLTGPVILDWGNGIRIQLSPAGEASREVPAAASVAKGRAGRKPGPATLALIEAMQADGSAATQRSRAEYLTILRSAGHSGSDTSANLILAREAKRVFGASLGRSSAKASRTGGGGGRQPTAATLVLRERLRADAAKGDLRDATHYTRWLVDQDGIKLGLKQARPVVYRELRVVKSI